jgi:hypothetical protein
MVLFLATNTCQTGASGPVTGAANSKQRTGAATEGGPKIGGPCKPEDGWQYKFPPGWPDGTQVADGGGPVAIPVPPDFMEDFQLDPGIKYCVTRLRAYPDGFFTSNCKSDSDCSEGARCDDSWCNAPCGGDEDCRAGLYCPLNGSKTRFCRQGCPISMPADGDGSCYDYGGPWTCPYDSGGAKTVCRCVSRPQNTAVWECGPQ